jgi:hypothetical protein
VRSPNFSRLVAGIGVRPPRVAVLVPGILPWSHLTLLNAVIAAQARTWGVHGNLVLPWTPDLADRELFWEIVERLDPDLFVLYVPTFEEIAEIDPASHREYINREHAKFAREHDVATADQLISADRSVLGRATTTRT